MFPLIEHESTVNDRTSAPPSKPTLWILGPGNVGHHASYDVRCLRVQAALAFAGEELAFRVWPTEDGAPGGSSKRASSAG